MARVVLSIGSNLGDRLARLQSVVDGLGEAVVAISPVYETLAWGRVDQGPFLNAILIADDPGRDAQAWLRRGQEFEQLAGRIRGERWGPRTLDVDLIACYQAWPAGETEVICRENNLTLPHPLAHLRAFVMIPWLAVDPDAMLTVPGGRRRVMQLLAEVDPADRDGVRLADLALTPLTRPKTDG
jgi:2-amino-4-hydroxy-6-hydroxymethyldihydropteridine diphosphokinase